MNTEMPKTYDPASVEHAWYEKWERNGYFHAAPNPDKTPFTIVIPPPNITGKRMSHMQLARDVARDSAAQHHGQAAYGTCA